MNARDAILARIRSAKVDDSGPVVPRDYHGLGQVLVGDSVAMLVERLEDYGATVRRCASADVVATIAATLQDRGARRVVTPEGLDPDWISAVPEPIADAPALTTDQLDRVDGVLTAVVVAIAQTGTLVLDSGPGQGRRAVTLVPDYHLAVVTADQIVAAVPDGVAAVVPTRPQTWISGPSATSDIELVRVAGVHGPRTLEVIIAG